MARCLDWRRHYRDLIWHGEMAAGLLSGQRRRRIGVWSGQFAHHIVTLGLLFLADSALWRRIHSGLCGASWSCVQAKRIRSASRDERSGEALACVDKTSKVSRADENSVKKGETMGTILMIILILLLIGVLPAWPHSSGWGYYPSGGIGLILLIVIILALTGHL